MDSYVDIGGKSLCLGCMTSFPRNQRDSHKDSTHHKLVATVLSQEPKAGEFYCKVCKRMGRKNSNHEGGKRHKKAKGMLEDYQKYLDDGEKEPMRYKWDKVFSSSLRDRVVLVGGSDPEPEPKPPVDGSDLFNQFQDESAGWYDADDVIIEKAIKDIEKAGKSNKRKGNDNGDGSKEEVDRARKARDKKVFLALMLEVRRIGRKGPESKIGQSICGVYDSIHKTFSDTDASRLWLLEHNFSSAKDLLNIVKEAKPEVLREDGFWIVHDARKSASLSSRRKNLSTLLERSEFCQLKFQTSHFGASFDVPDPPNFSEEVSFHLRDFILQSMALEHTISDLMGSFEIQNVKADIFREALFYNIPSHLHVLYDDDLDLDRRISTTRLGFTSGQSVVDARSSHLEMRTQDDYDEQVVDVYKFSWDELKHVEAGDCKVAHNIPLVDDGFGACVRAWVAGQQGSGGVLRMIHGVTRGAIITSMFGSKTSIHVEDSMLATFNLLVWGAPKIWYMVPNRRSFDFMEFLRKKEILQAAMEKRCFVHAFARGEHSLSEKDMKKYEVRRFVQHPGTTVMSVPGMIFHWTISTGFSLADSINWYFKYDGGLDLRGLEELWSSYEESCGEFEAPSSITSKQYFDVCKTFNVC